MFVIFLLLLVFIVVLGNGSILIMRIRLAKRSTSADRLGWWRRGSDELSEMYEHAYPGSYLPLLSKLSFWIFLVVAGVLADSLWR